MTDHAQKPPIERAVELIVYAPLGLVLLARDMVPPLVNRLVERGKTQFGEIQDQVDNKVGQARIMGQFAVSQGRKQVKKEVERRVDDLRQRGEHLTKGIGHDSDPAAPGPPSRVAPAVDPEVAAGNGSSSPDASHLPIRDYDELSASQVVARLAGLSRDELEAVQRYEEGQRQRKTILTKIEQLIA